MAAILLITARDMDRMLLARWIRPTGHTLYTSTDGKAALGEANGKRFDLVLMNHELPDMESASLARQLRAIPGFESVPIILLAPSSELTPEATDSGITGLIKKPFASGNVQESIANALGTPAS